MSVKNDQSNESGRVGRLVAAGGPEDLEKKTSVKKTSPKGNKPNSGNKNHSGRKPAPEKKARPAAPKEEAPKKPAETVVRPPMRVFQPHPDHRPYYGDDREVYIVRDAEGRVHFKSNCKGACKIFRDYHSQEKIESNMTLVENPDKKTALVHDASGSVLFQGSPKEARDFVCENKLVRKFKNLRVSKGRDHPLYKK